MSMYWWMALGSISWGTLVVGTIFFLGRALTTRTRRPNAAAEISEEEIKAIQDKFPR